MIKALSLFLLVFALAATTGFAQVTATPAATEKDEKVKKDESLKVEARISPAEQAERDLLVPRKYQQELAENANKPIKYGPANGTARKTYSRKSYSRSRYTAKKRSSKGRSSGYRRSSSKKSTRRR